MRYINLHFTYLLLLTISLSVMHEKTIQIVKLSQMHMHSVFVKRAFSRVIQRMGKVSQTEPVKITGAVFLQDWWSFYSPTSNVKALSSTTASHPSMIKRLLEEDILTIIGANQSTPLWGSTKTVKVEQRSSKSQEVWGSWGGDVPLPASQGSGKHCKLSQWGSGESLATWQFGTFSRPTKPLPCGDLNLFQWNFCGVRAIEDPTAKFCGVQTPGPDLHGIGTYVNHSCHLSGASVQVKCKWSSLCQWPFYMWTCSRKAHSPKWPIMCLVGR